jgi:opacity protein-like surface antigen
MKSHAILFTLLFTGFTVHAQLSHGDVETSFSLALQSMSSGGSSSSGGSTSTNLLLSARIGFFPMDRFEIEPEFTVLKAENVNALYLFNANLVYNFELATGKAHPFLLAGYGISNSFPLFDILGVNFDTTIGVLNLGAGMKVFVANNVAVRFEYRYQKFTGSKSGPSYAYSYTYTIDMNSHTVHVGFSIVL